jgi:hypothetical protein
LPGAHSGDRTNRTRAQRQVGTVLTLFFLPALYAFWFRVRKPESVAVRPADGGHAEPAVAIKARRPADLMVLRD